MEPRFLVTTGLTGTVSQEILKVNRRKRSLRGSVQGLSYIDKDTKQHVCFLPSLDLTSYGETLEKAEEMMKACLVELWKYLSELSEEQMMRELRALGWHRSAIFTKEYSKAYVDENGILQDLNAKDGKVERFSLQAA